MTHTPTDTDVIVVGGGPSGLTTASELALAGVRVTVLERRTRPVESRAGTVLPRVLELLDARGLADRFIERARAIKENPLIPVHIWAGMQPVHWHHLNSRFGFRLIMPQNITEELLLERVREQGVPVRHGVHAESVTQDGDGVRVTAAEEGGERVELTARYVVGADGGRSTVRQQAGIGFEGHGATFTGIVADLRAERLGPDWRLMTDNEHGWITSFPWGRDGEQLIRFNIVHAERRHAPQEEPVTEEEVRRCLREITGEEIAFDGLRWASRFTDALRLATAFRDRRILLVGEAARIHYPASGVGMNFCIQDAFNLGWKLAAVVRGHAGDSLLDTYEEERRPVAEELLRSVEAQCAVQFDFTPEGVAFKRMFAEHLMPLPEVNSRLAHELNGLTFPYPSPPGSHPLAGRRAPDLELVTRDGVRRVHELLRGQEFLLIDCAGDDAYAGLDTTGLPLRTVSGAAVLTGPELRSVRSLLIRPDAYVAWADELPPSPARAADAVKRWIGAAR
ncbi:FAD-dependent oxidoreductase [Streptomyces sp. DSM 44917]|uniref:FAD-dependent oxidoreductase n=1 Tax=Streptomyces boetiae TaxID=3075541 RepID=A0ABU2L7J5_9ACTN|nr:FAD-dependent oxidoreductase [Streptomyces sp. DSM 44917]MDT0307532.1 FAD-dependent oxidoreductase [Streptomyces sp. DSM 44917]